MTPNPNQSYAIEPNSSIHAFCFDTNNAQIFFDGRVTKVDATGITILVENVSNFANHGYIVFLQIVSGAIKITRS